MSLSLDPFRQANGRPYLVFVNSAVSIKSHHCSSGSIEGGNGSHVSCFLPDPRIRYCTHSTSLTHSSEKPQLWNSRLWSQGNLSQNNDMNEATLFASHLLQWSKTRAKKTVNPLKQNRYSLYDDEYALCTRVHNVCDSFCGRINLDVRTLITSTNYLPVSVKLLHWRGDGSWM